MKYFNDLSDMEKYLIREYDSWIKSAHESGPCGAAWEYKLSMIEYYFKKIHEAGLYDFIKKEQ